MNKFFDAVYDYHLCTYYLLPLTRLNKYAFGHNNFKQCYVNRDNPMLLHVEVFYIPMRIDQQQTFQYAQKQDGRMFITFLLPDEWLADVDLFLQGKYSQFSSDAKRRIVDHAGLSYKQIKSENGKPYTDARLMAIDDDLKMRTFLKVYIENALGVRLNASDELMSPPNYDCFIYYSVEQYNKTTSLESQVQS